MFKNWFTKLEPKITQISKDLRRYNGRLQIKSPLMIHDDGTPCWDEFDKTVRFVWDIGSQQKAHIAGIDMPQKYRQLLFDKCKELTRKHRVEEKRLQQIVKRLK